MRCAIMQPTYLPWLGYFDLMDQVDVFILLDNVQFDKRSWQQRNRIKSNNGLCWLTVPVVVGGRFDQIIANVQIQDDVFAKKHIGTIQHNYARSAYFDKYFSDFRDALQAAAQTGRLSEVNVQMLHHLSEALGVETPVMLASEISTTSSRTGRLAELCAGVRAATYVSPQGSADYLLKDIREFESRNIEVVFHNYEHPAYRQLFPPFIPYASVVDLLLNEGPQSLDIIRSGRRPGISISEMKGLSCPESNEWQQ